MAAGEKEPSCRSSSLRDSLTMLPPIKASSTKAIQWSTLVMRASNWEPSSQPRKGIRA